VAGEVGGCLELIRRAYTDLGIEPARYRLSLAGPAAKYAGREEMWDQAAGILRKALADAGLPYDTEEGEAAFYGPKIDIQVADSSEREATLSTIQADFYQPERFGLTYIGPDNSRHRPVMVHRSIIGSLERLTAHLIEIHRGAFPPWLAPTQLTILPVTDDQIGAGRALADAATASGLRAELHSPESGSATLGARIRQARLVPYLAIIGPAEAASAEVSLRLRDGRQVGIVRAEDALAGILGRVRERSRELWPAS
jgi:threonyl-tRNA synthetase